MTKQEVLCSLYDKLNELQKAKDDSDNSIAFVFNFAYDKLKECIELVKQINMQRSLEMYLIRDENGSLWLFTEKPIKFGDVWCVPDGKEYSCTFMPNALFPEVKWEDKEPTEIEIIIKNK